MSGSAENIDTIPAKLIKRPNTGAAAYIKVIAPNIANINPVSIINILIVFPFICFYY